MQAFFVGSELYMLGDFKELGELVVQVSGKEKGQVMVREIEPFKTILAGLKEEAEANNVLDFEKRIKGTALEFALS